MYQHTDINDTIASIATPAGSGGIGIVRVSGPQALAIADRVFRPKNGKPSAFKNFTVHYGWVVDDAQALDEALLTIMRGPHSYTAQDVVEISGHGGPAILRAILELVLRSGARLAEPGEFTKRAFLNGRIDLAQAEAVLDIINAKTAAFARASQNQLRGELSAELHQIRDALLAIYTTIEAVINFPEDDTDIHGRALIFERLHTQAHRIDELLATAPNGRLLKEGIRIVLCGKPNVGKSSLLNVLLKQDRAIVTPIAGTTRDALEETAQINGVPLQLIDTAGMLEPRDIIEEEAVKRSHVVIDSADLILLVLDASAPLDDTDRLLIKKIQGRPVVCVLNKHDLPQQLAEQGLPDGKKVKISALSKQGIDNLERAIIDSVWQEGCQGRGIILNNIRHVKALTSAHAMLSEAMALKSAPWELVSQNIKDTVNHLDSITGRNIDEDLLDRIFSEFCIGK